MEFLGDMLDVGELAKQSQRDLAITYWERMALRAHSDGMKAKAR